jgi:hypothetical protein
VPHGERVFGDHFAGICPQNRNSQNFAPSAGEHIHLSTGFGDRAVCTQRKRKSPSPTVALKTAAAWSNSFAPSASLPPISQNRTVNALGERSSSRTRNLADAIDLQRFQIELLCFLEIFSIHHQGGQIRQRMTNVRRLRRKLSPLYFERRRRRSSDSVASPESASSRAYEESVET